MFEWMQRQSHQTLHVMLIQWIKQVLHRCIGFQVSGMAEGDWRLPRQFAGLIGRSDTELELRPFECLEIEGGMDELPPCLPKSRGWVVATENYEGLEELNRVWHYVDRAMNVACERMRTSKQLTGSCGTSHVCITKTCGRGQQTSCSERSLGT